MLYILSCFLGSLLFRFLLPLICTLLRVGHAPGVPLLPFLYSLLQSSFHPSVSSPSGSHSPVPILKRMGILISCFSLFLHCPCPFPVDCLQAFLVVVLDLMTPPQRCPFFLFPIVSAFFPCCVVVFLHCVLGLLGGTTGALALNLSAALGTAPMVVPKAPNVTVGTFGVALIL
jgi:hypothetical protein